MAKRRNPTRLDIPNHAHFLTFSCYRRLPLFRNEEIRNAFETHLEHCRQSRSLAIHAWVLMPEHVHMVVTPGPEDSISSVLRSIKEPMARKCLARWRKLAAPVLTHLVDAQDAAHFWQRGGGYDRNIISPDEMAEKTKYIHDNPIRRGLVKQATDWKSSSARWYAGERNCTVQIRPAL